MITTIANMNSNVLVVFVAVCLCQVFATVDENVNKLACLREADVNPSLVEKAYNGEVSNERELQCYFKCYYENAGYINPKGEIQEDKLRANIPSGISKSMAGKIIDICKTKKGKDACETAYLTQKCLLDNDLKY